MKRTRCALAHSAHGELALIGEARVIMRVKSVWSPHQARGGGIQGFVHAAGLLQPVLPAFVRRVKFWSTWGVGAASRHQRPESASDMSTPLQPPAAFSGPDFLLSHLRSLQLRVIQNSSLRENLALSHRRQAFDGGHSDRSIISRERARPS